MDEKENANLDIEFKRHLQIMKPYLEQLLDEDVIEICKTWIQRLSYCKKDEKNLRNKYILFLCFQLAKGTLSGPFLNFPSDQELPPLNYELDSDISSTKIDYMILSSDEEMEEDNTNLPFNNKKLPASKTELHSQGDESNSEKSFVNKNEELQLQEGTCHKRTVNCTETIRAPRGFENYKVSCAEYKYRTNNLVLKLRELKTQNMLMQLELDTLRREIKTASMCDGGDHDNNTRDGICTSCYHSKDSFMSLNNNIRAKLEGLQGSRNDLISTIEKLQEKLDNYEDIKKYELDEIKACHKMNIIKIKTSTREEMKEMYEKKIEDLKQHYETMIKNMQNTIKTEKQEVIATKDSIISEKEHTINEKDKEIVRLTSLNDDQKSHLQGVINNFLEKSGDDSYDNIKYKAEQLEKSLNKAEKAKVKCVKVYEAKLAQMQREKKLAECSMQLQMVKLRAQVVNDLTEENQSEVSTALNKLENKYKEIVGNTQAAAIQRRVQDQIAIESIVQAACGMRNENYANCSQGTHRNQFSGKTMQNQNRNGNQMNQSFDSEISALLSGNKVVNLVGGNKSLGEGCVTAGYCLDGERMGELFDRVYIPQRDIGDGPLKK